MNKQTPHSLGCTIKGMTRTSYHKLHCLQQRDGFSYNSQSPKSESGCGWGPGPLHLGSRKRVLLPPPGLAAASSTPSPLGVPMSPLLVGSLDLGYLIRGELGRWLLEKLLELLLEVCELEEQGPWKARPAVRTGLQCSLLTVRGPGIPAPPKLLDSQPTRRLSPALPKVARSEAWFLPQ